MLQTSFIRDNTNLVIERLKKRNIDATNTVNSIIELDDKRKKTQQELDALLAESNQLAKQIGDLFKSGKTEEANQLKNRTTEIKELSSTLKEEQNSIATSLQQLLYTLPNLPNEIVPNGKSAEDNLNVYENNTIPTLPKNALPHWELAKKYDLIDFELGVKITGAGFPI